MGFSEKLDYLIRIFGSNNSKLAKAIRVDPSLVSKWRTGSRSLNSKSAYLQMITDYFLNIAALQNKMDVIIELLRQANKNVEFCSQTQINELFTQWFLSAPEAEDCSKHVCELYKNINDEIYCNINGDEDGYPSGIKNILYNLNSICTAPLDEATGKARMFLQSCTKRGETSSYELFKGKSGKRQLTLNILNMLFTASEPVVVYFMDEAGLDWLIEDKGFYLFFHNCLKQLIAKGHKFKIVHHVMRSPTQLVPLIDFWLPLYMTGCVSSYYYPKYLNNVHRKSICVASGLITAISVFIETEKDISNVMVFEDPMMIKISEAVFNSYMTSCRLLVKTYTNINFDEVYPEICDMEEKLGSFYSLKNGLSSISMPLEVYSRLLDKMDMTQAERKKRLKLHSRRMESFKRNVLCNKYVEIINSESFDKFNPETPFTYDSFELFTKKGAVCDTGDVVKHLKNIVNMLREYSNYEIILLGLSDIVHQNKATISFKEDEYVIATTCSSSGDNLNAAVLKEPYIIKGIEYYLSGMVDYVPESRINKPAVIKRFERIIAILESCEKG